MPTPGTFWRAPAISLWRRAQGAPTETVSVCGAQQSRRFVGCIERGYVRAKRYSAMTELLFPTHESLGTLRFRIPLQMGG
jgi:hypothetical protein